MPRKPWTKYIARGNVQGGEGGELRRSSRSNNVAALLGRLRRLELVVMYLMDYSNVRKLTARELDNILGLMYDAASVDEVQGSGDQGLAQRVPVPHSGPVDGQVEAEAGQPGGSGNEQWRNPADDETP